MSSWLIHIYIGLTILFALVIFLQTLSDLESFKQKMIEHYKKEGRGKYCTIVVLKRSSPERYCYFVKLQDYGDVIEEFKNPTTTEDKPVKPVFQVIFVYHSESGRIETNAKGIEKKIKQLHEAFCQGVLNMDKLPDKNSVMYKLNKLKTPFGFMPRDPQDNIASVKLKFIELEVNPKRHIGFTDSSKQPDIYNLINDALNQEKIPLDSVKVAKAKIYIEFKKMANERKPKTVTFDLLPDRCSLKDSATHQVAQKHIEMWELVSDETIEVEEAETKAEEPVT